MPMLHTEKPGILVVDDDHLIRIMLRLGLERNGFIVWVAADGHEAIETYCEHREQIAVVLLDVCIPGLDGPHTLDQLRELNPEIRVCFMSGDTGQYTRWELLQRGASQVIAKPFLLNELAETLWLEAQRVQIVSAGADRVVPYSERT